MPSDLKVFLQGVFDKAHQLKSLHLADLLFPSVISTNAAI
jgi:hypothetical protein